MNFLGELRKQKLVKYDYPTPSKIVSFVIIKFPGLLSSINKKEQQRLIGLGIGKPYQLWNWLDRFKAPQLEMAKWKTFGFKEELSKYIDCEIIVEMMPHALVWPNKLSERVRKLKILPTSSSAHSSAEAW